MFKESLKVPLFTDGFHLSDLLCQSYPPTHSVFMKNTSGMAVEMECFRPLAHWPFASAHDGFGKRNSVRPESVHVTISRSDSLCSDAGTSSVSDRAVGPGTKSRHMAGTQIRDTHPATSWLPGAEDMPATTPTVRRAGGEGFLWKPRLRPRLLR